MPIKISYKKQKAVINTSYIYKTMISINPIILEALEQHVRDIKAPDDVKKLLISLLEIEVTVKGFSGDYKGIDKLYNSALQNYVDKTEIMKWSEIYVQQ